MTYCHMRHFGHVHPRVQRPYSSWVLNPIDMRDCVLYVCYYYRRSFLSLSANLVRIIIQAFCFLELKSFTGKDFISLFSRSNSVRHGVAAEAFPPHLFATLYLRYLKQLNFPGRSFFKSAPRYPSIPRARYRFRERAAKYVAPSRLVHLLSIYGLGNSARASLI